MLGKVHGSDVVNVNKTYLLNQGRASIFKPCTSQLKIREHIELNDSSDCHGHSVFQKTDNDEKPGLSQEDRTFLQVMDNDFQKHPSGNWVAPLPFRTPRPTLPNNRKQALKRAQLLDSSLQKNPVKKEHFVSFMKGVIDSGYAEVAPPLDGEECWYLPLFGVYHPKKPDQIRGVFDSSAKYQGVSLNDVMLTGPDLTNNLLGILLRFRKEPVAVTADVQQMFYNFLVRDDHRNFLRFLWYMDNDPEKELIRIPNVCTRIREQPVASSRHIWVKEDC